MVHDGMDTSGKRVRCKQDEAKAGHHPSSLTSWILILLSFSASSLRRSLLVLHSLWSLLAALCRLRYSTLA